MPKKETFTIPDLSAILKLSRVTAWKPPRAEHIPHNTYKKLAYQATVPQDTHLAQKLGIIKKDRLFIFAGYYGDWAYALSQICSVTYSDISREIVSYVVKEKYPNLMKSFCVADGALLPIPKNTDWLFSFEPITLEYVHFPLILLQGMSQCEKGVMVAYNMSHTDFRFPTISEMAALYGAKYDASKISVSLRYRSLLPDCVEKEHWIYKLETTPTAKARATLDLELILHLQKKSSGITKIFQKEYSTSFFDGASDVITVAMIAKMGELLGKNKDEILESLRRITKTSKFIQDKKCVKKRTFSER